MDTDCELKGNRSERLSDVTVCVHFGSLKNSSKKHGTRLTRPSHGRVDGFVVARSVGGDTLETGSDEGRDGEFVDCGRNGRPEGNERTRRESIQSQLQMKSFRSFDSQTHACLLLRFIDHESHFPPFPFQTYLSVIPISRYCSGFSTF